jgi:hypothetical protein
LPKLIANVKSIWTITSIFVTKARDCAFNRVILKMILKMFHNLRFRSTLKSVLASLLLRNSYTYVLNTTTIMRLLDLILIKDLPLSNFSFILKIYSKHTLMKQFFLFYYWVPQHLLSLKKTYRSLSSILTQTNSNLRFY